MDDSLHGAFTQKTYRARDLRLAGVVVPDDPAVLSPIVREAIRSGQFEATEARMLAGAVEPGDRVVEIGAGIGFISTLLARDARVRSVVAVEANPTLLDYMERLHRRNRVTSVRRLNVVLDDAAQDGGFATFYLRHDFWMGSLAPRPNPYYATVEVPTYGFSALLREEDATFIVCDVEGAEVGLFDRADLGRVERILLELHDHVTGLSGVGSLFARLAAKGFVYDPRHSCGSVVLFRKLRDPDIPRPYAG
jgi:FkbM family methyltransferase